MEQDNFCDIPDKIEQVMIKQINFNEQLNQFEFFFEITPPDNNNKEIENYTIKFQELIKSQKNPQIKFDIPLELINNIDSSKNLVKLQIEFSCNNILGQSPILIKNYQLRKLYQCEYILCGLGDQNQFNLDLLKEKSQEFDYDYENNLMKEFINIPLFQQKTNYFKVNKSSFLITNNGELLQWGFALDINDDNNEIYQIQSSHFLPEFPQKEYIIDINCGLNSVIALTAQGRLYSWGINNYGQLGQCDKIDRIKPELIKQLMNQFIIQISLNYEHALALSNEGQIYVWGKHQAIGGKEILNSYNDCIDYENFFIDQIGPRLVEIPMEKGWKISTGGDFSVCITQSKKLYAWGHNINNQLGIEFPELSQEITHVSIPRQVNINKPCIEVSCGYQHTLLLVNNNNNEKSGQLWSYGYAKGGECGIGNLKYQKYPAVIDSVKDIEFIQISAGVNHSLALSNKNQVYAFGENYMNQIGNIGQNQVLEPISINQFIPQLKDKTIVEINAASEISSIMYYSKQQ